MPRSRSWSRVRRVACYSELPRMRALGSWVNKGKKKAGAQEEAPAPRRRSGASYYSLHGPVFELDALGGPGGYVA
jgi:hypothetical protein